MELVGKIKSKVERVKFSTDIIVGFPGETEVDFADTLQVMQQVKFAKVHMFPYSDRPRTRSCLMPNKVSQDVMKERKQTVLRLSEQLSFELRETYIGRRMEVLTESVDPGHPGEIAGHTMNFLPVLVQGNGFESNQLIEVELIANTARGLVGRPLSQSEHQG